MASHLKADILHGRDHQDTHASSNKWRHEESRSFAKHAGLSAGPKSSRLEGEDTETGSSLADFLNQSRVEPTGPPKAGGKGHVPIVLNGAAKKNEHEQVQPDDLATTNEKTQPGRGRAAGPRKVDGREIKCGPLLNYRRMEGSKWFGSVLIVNQGGIIDGEEFVPELILRRVGTRGDKKSRPIEANITNKTEDNIASEAGSAPVGESSKTEVVDDQLYGHVEGGEERVKGVKLYSDMRHIFWRFGISVEMKEAETNWEYEIPGLRFTSEGKRDKQNFFVPSIHESMRVMFHSCNGFSVGTDEKAWSGPALWNDVIRVRVSFPCDIIDGFGSYVSEFMRCDVFRGIGGVAYKYYMLFQHHLPPPISSFTTDAPQTTRNDGDGVGADPVQLRDTYVLENEPEDPSYIIGKDPSPYVEEHSRSIYARLGARIAFFGIDARTERTRHQVNYPETYDLIINRVKKELSEAAASSRPIQHLIVLLGIPIAYPRLTWLENIFSSPLMGPIKFLNKRFGIAGGFINHFDGSVDLLDDLDDHYTARTHKKERHGIMIRLQELAQEFSVRITILGGDVHLAALGRFYSNPSLHIPAINDHRYMVNIISSAIVNKPPPSAIANLLARRNKLHHLNPDTDETLLKLFDCDPGKSVKTAKSNHVTMPSRNWARITENSPTTTVSETITLQVDGTTSEPSSRPATNGNSTNGHQVPTATEAEPKEAEATGNDGHFPLGPGEYNAGTQNRAAGPRHGLSGNGSLDVSIRVEMDQHDPSGATQAYGMYIPVLKARKLKNPQELEGERKDTIGDKIGEGTGAVVKGVGDVVKGKVEGSDGKYS